MNIQDALEELHAAFAHAHPSLTLSADAAQAILKEHYVPPDDADIPRNQIIAAYHTILTELPPVLRVTAQYLVLLDGAEEVSVEIGSGQVCGTRGGIAGVQGTQGTRQSRWDGWRLAHGDWSALYDDALHDSYRRAE